MYIPNNKVIGDMQDQQISLNGSFSFKIAVTV